MSDEKLNVIGYCMDIWDDHYWTGFGVLFIKIVNYTHERIFSCDKVVPPSRID
jgi:hypothetical protein